MCMRSNKNLPDSPLVSVIIPTYNRGWVLRETIESVLAQNYGNVELIVVDDGSTDDTPGILAAFNRVTALHQSNRGVSAARNSGVAHARGQFIAFLDSDDLWMPEKLSVQLDFFQNNPKAMICQTQEIWMRNGRRVNSGKRHQKPSGMFFERSLELCLVSPSAVMMRKKFFTGMGGFDEQLLACEDYDLWLRIGVNHPIFLIDRPLIVKRGGHADQLSAGIGLDKYRIQSITKLLDIGVLSPEQEKAAVCVLKDKCRVYAGGCHKRGRLREAAYYRSISDAYC
ncbi:MAG: glycosyltransferase [Deltaproteobacteria bacterium]|nr:glycosyltransferase [Deltaproteobacteria bacterium]